MNHVDKINTPNGLISAEIRRVPIKETVDHPEHYQGKTEVIDIIEQATEGIDGRVAFSLGNVIKYIMRHQHKGGVEDLKKAEWYLKRAIELEGK